MSLGREWFEAQNNKYHVRDYAVVRGFNAWVVYFGSKPITARRRRVALAARAVEAFLPDPRKPLKKPGDDDDDNDDAPAAAARIAADFR